MLYLHYARSIGLRYKNKPLVVVNGDVCKNQKYVYMWIHRTPYSQYLCIGRNWKLLIEVSDNHYRPLQVEWPVFCMDKYISILGSLSAY